MSQNRLGKKSAKTRPMEAQSRAAEAHVFAATDRQIAKNNEKRETEAKNITSLLRIPDDQLSEMDRARINQALHMRTMQQRQIDDLDQFKNCYTFLKTLSLENDPKAADYFFKIEDHTVSIQQLLTTFVFELHRVFLHRKPTGDFATDFETINEYFAGSSLPERTQLLAFGRLGLTSEEEADLMALRKQAEAQLEQADSIAAVRQHSDGLKNNPFSV